MMILSMMNESDRDPWNEMRRWKCHCCCCRYCCGSSWSRWERIGGEGRQRGRKRWIWRVSTCCVDVAVDVVLLVVASFFFFVCVLYLGSGLGREWTGHINLRHPSFSTPNRDIGQSDRVATVWRRYFLPFQCTVKQTQRMEGCDSCSSIQLSAISHVTWTPEKWSALFSHSLDDQFAIGHLVVTQIFDTIACHMFALRTTHHTSS